MHPPEGLSGKVARSEAGTVLVLVLLVLALISVLVLSWSQEWQTELKLAGNFRENRQNRRLAEAGVYYALGKLLSTKIDESQRSYPEGGLEPVGAREHWQADGSPHVLELPAGRIEVRLEDEGGKINLNRARDVLLGRLFAILGFSEIQIRTIVDSIQDWRSKGDTARSYGAKSPYYLGLAQPYVAKNGLFETVEELAWVRGFEGYRLINRLGEFLTVQPKDQGVNINTASKEVLQAVGLPPDAAEAVIASRQTTPFTNPQQMMPWNTHIQDQPGLLTLRTASFFTIKSTGIVKPGRGRHTMKVIVRLHLDKPNPWEIVHWVDDFPG
ncbi:MAG: general secretion pathway protein GspK [Thermodesulfobacteriota bacterium]